MSENELGLLSIGLIYVGIIFGVLSRLSKRIEKLEKGIDSRQSVD